VAWRFAGSRTLPQTAEQRAQRGVAVSFWLRAPYIPGQPVADHRFANDPGGGDTDGLVFPLKAFACGSVEGLVCPRLMTGASPIRSSSASLHALEEKPMVIRRATHVLAPMIVLTDGTVSAGTEDIFKAFTTQSAADKDLNGDGTPDLLTVGGTPGLAAGLWLATGTAKHPPAAAKGRLNVPAGDIGVNGWSSTPGSPSDFNGAQAADFDGDGVPDLWAVTQSGVARGYRISALSTTATATVKAGKPQNLSAHP
jgi:hypothetical protein